MFQSVSIKNSCKKNKKWPTRRITIPISTQNSTSICFIQTLKGTKVKTVEAPNSSTCNASDVAKSFDVVTSSLCLEACVSSETHYKNTVAELCKMLKPNGYLFMNGVLEQTFYFVGEEKFYTFPLTEKIIKEAMNEAGIEIDKFVTIPVDYSEVCDCKNLFFTYGKKSA